MWRAATVGATTIVARPTIELQGEGLPMFNSYRLMPISPRGRVLALIVKRSRGRHATPRQSRLLAQRQSIGLQNRGRGFDSPAACQSEISPPHGGLFSYRAARGGGFSMPARAKTTRRTAVTAVAGKLRHMVPTVMRDQVPYDPARPGRDPSKHSVSGSQGAAKSETGTEVKAGKASRDILTSYSWPPCW